MASGQSAGDGSRAAGGESDGEGDGATGAGGDDRPVEEAPLPPGPASYPLVGNTLQLVRDPFGFLADLRSHGDVVRYRVARRAFTALFDPDLVERVLVEEPDRFDRFSFADQGFNFAPDGILFAGDEQWRRQRKLMQPAFTMGRIRSYADTMAGYAADAADDWTGGDAIAVNDAFSALTLRILAKALFDVEVDPATGDGTAAATAAEDGVITRAARVINERGDARSINAFLPGWLPTPANRRYRRAMADFEARMDELIDDRRSGGAAGADGRGGGEECAAGDDLLSILLDAEGPDGETLSEAEVRDNLLTFVFAGHETTSLALTYAVLLLAEHDGVAARLREELDRVLDGDRPRFEHVPELEYTERVVREAMRLYPPAYMIFREATEDAVLGGYRVPEGTVLSLPQYAIHRDERFYDEPEAFRPERWSDDLEAELPEYAYFPFGGGPRHCIGMRFAMLELQLVLATVGQRFDLALASDPDPELAPGVTLQPAEDVRVRFHPR